MEMKMDAGRQAEQAVLTASRQPLHKAFSFLQAPQNAKFGGQRGERRLHSYMGYINRMVKLSAKNSNIRS
jgi:hypothetical protein